MSVNECPCDSSNSTGAPFKRTLMQLFLTAICYMDSDPEFKGLTIPVFPNAQVFINIVFYFLDSKFTNTKNG